MYVAERLSLNLLLFWSSLYSSPRAAYSRMRYTRFWESREIVRVRDASRAGRARLGGTGARNDGTPLAARRWRERGIRGGTEHLRGSYLVVEVSVQAQDVGMAQMRLDLDLSTELVLDVRLLQLILEQNLERDDVLALLLARQVDVTELTAPERLTDVEIAQLRE